MSISLHELGKVSSIVNFRHLICKDISINDIQMVFIITYEPAFVIIGTGDLAKRDPHTRQSANHRKIMFLKRSKMCHTAWY